MCTLAGHSGPVGSASFSSDGKWILSGSEDTLVKIWDVATRLEVSSLSPQPSTLDPQPSTLNHQPSIFNPTLWLVHLGEFGDDEGGGDSLNPTRVRHIVAR